MSLVNVSLKLRSLNMARVATYFLHVFQNSQSFPWLFTIFQIFSTASQLLLQQSSATKSSNRALTFRELNKHLKKQWGQFCKFICLKIKKTATAISILRKFSNSLTSPWLLSVFFQFPWLKPKIPWLFPDLEKFSFSRLFSLTLATLMAYYANIFAEKMLVAFAFAKATHTFSAKKTVNKILYLLEQLIFWPLMTLLS